MVSEDKTEKYLFRLSDDSLIETVLMRHNYGLSVCVSTQVGCNMMCFCEWIKRKGKKFKSRGNCRTSNKVQKELVKIMNDFHVVIMNW